MTQADVVSSIANDLTQLDMTLMSSALNGKDAQWQLLYAQRKHLDDQQRDLLVKTIQSDDAGFQVYAQTIDTASKQLNQVVANLKQVDKIIQIASQISATLDTILKQF